MTLPQGEASLSQDMDELIPIGRIAAAAQVSQKALRLYDEEGLLRPVRVDESSGYRLYSPEQIHDARLIHFLRRGGMPLAAIRDFLADRRPELIDEHEAKLDAEHAARRKELAVARRILEARSTFEVAEKRVEAVRYAGRRSRVAADDLDAFVAETVRELAAAHEPAGPPFAMYHEFPKADDGDVEVGVPTPTGDLELPAATVVFTILRGDQARYPKIIAGYDAVWDWIHARKREFAGPPREVYPEDGVIELQWPIA